MVAVREGGVVGDATRRVVAELGRGAPEAVRVVGEPHRRAVLNLGGGDGGVGARVGGGGVAVLGLRLGERLAEFREVDARGVAALHHAPPADEGVAESGARARRLRAGPQHEEVDRVRARQKRERGQVPQRQVRHAPNLELARFALHVDCAVPAFGGELEGGVAALRPVAVLGCGDGAQDGGELERLEEVLPVRRARAVATHRDVHPRRGVLLERRHARPEPQIGERVVHRRRARARHQSHLLRLQPHRVRAARPGELQKPALMQKLHR
mmetsp:Transcript_343/g.1126  ORF Transcript_343/g.1126 Transcript_343/m.1126 type:complete len:269 (-) Transcript_343:897-1703(-)